MYIYLCLYECLCIYKYIHTYVCIYKYIFIYLCMCIYTSPFSILGWKESEPGRQIDLSLNSISPTHWLTLKFLSDKMAIQCHIYLITFP